MTESENLQKSIIEGIQEIKGEDITIVNLTSINDCICQYFVICQGNTPNQLIAIADSIKENLRDEHGLSPSYVEGTRYAHWIAMDYGDIMIHILTPELRLFYNLENLWADATLTNIPNLE